MAATTATASGAPATTGYQQEAQEHHEESHEEPQQEPQVIQDSDEEEPQQEPQQEPIDTELIVWWSERLLQQAFDAIVM